MEKVTIRQISNEEIEERGITGWGIWEKEVSSFPWHYDAEEECLLIEGEVEVDTGEKKYTIQAGDFVTFKKGLDCHWNVKKPVRKYFRFKE